MRPSLLAALVTLPLLSLAARPTQAACTFTPTTGNDSYLCDSGTAPSLTDPSGDNSLSLPAGGSGGIDGDVTFGAGADRVDMASGEVGGNLDQGKGTDHINMAFGVIRGNVQQGEDKDTFTISGGEILRSLLQGDGLDKFKMTGGWIHGAFEDGDFAEMDAGRIGRVDMRLDKNTFIMRGGTIDGNLVTGFDLDYVEVFDGFIGGNISVSGGDDQVLVHGGSVKGEVRLSTGNDRFTWDGGNIGGSVLLGDGDDQATLKNLGAEQLKNKVNGDAGKDELTFDTSTPTTGSLYSGWERIDLNNGSVLTLDDTLALGDATTGTGVLNIDASSSVVSQSGAIGPSQPGQHVTVNNAGLIDLRSGGNALGRLTINGNYVGNGGTLKLNTVLAGDGAASDRLVVNGGRISGTTNLQISNFGGAGAATSQNGIQVVEAASGAISSSGAFVQTQTLSAGAFDYRLFKGGVTPDSVNSWYLRSAVVAPAPVSQPEPVDPGPDPVDPGPVDPGPGEPIAVLPAPQAAPAPGQPDLPAPAPGVVIPLYRPEVAVYAAAPRAAALAARSALGTFHQRQGDQNLLNERGAASASWGQAYGNHFRQSWSGTVDPSLDGDLYGFKVGQDLYAWQGDNGYRQFVGLYVGHSRLNGDIKGFALGIEDRSVGDLKLDSDSVGAYWTLVGPQRWYVDAVVQYSDVDGRAKSDRGDKLDLNGHAWIASLEAGYPIALSPQWALEPQAQIIATSVSLDSADDSVAHVDYDAQTELTGRLGVRLEGNFKPGAVPLQLYLTTDFWHGDGGRDTLTFDNVDQVKTDYRYTSMDIGTGLVAQLNKSISLYGGIKYAANLDAHQQEGVGADLGVRISY
ncbi:autotransporter outer membrane beta-barrel domain-containing protein [Pseudomonas sp. NPDC090755]|uniref:autotransporter family protein n=1 Tax=Pseudomonas sp. NPDC090755 TaxID=3364481 RepID=UPI00383B9CE8